MSSLLTDPEIDSIIKHEEERQRDGLTLIASENYAYREVLEVIGSVFTNKYAEGYPGKRYYAGCEWADQAEILAIERCKKLFKAEHVNVQPHSGSSANMAAYMALLQPGDSIMGMSLSSGGHLTHGHNVSFSGVLYKSVSYTVDATSELLDYDHIETLARQYKPKLIIAGASSYSRILDFEKFHALAKSVGAYLVADCAHTAGLIAAGLYPNPFPYADVVTATTHKTLRGPRGGFIMCKQEFADRIDRAVFPLLQGGPFMNVIAAKAVTFKLAQEADFIAYQKQALKNAQAMIEVFQERGYRIVSDGTDTHLFVLDLTNKKITGKDAEKALEKENIYVSRSLIPFDPQSPLITSGIRIGTLALTAKGLKEKGLKEVVHLIDQILMRSFS